MKYSFQYLKKNKSIPDSPIHFLLHPSVCPSYSTPRRGTSMALVAVVVVFTIISAFFSTTPSLLCHAAPEVAHGVHLKPASSDLLSDHWVVELHAPASENNAQAIARQFGMEHRGALRYDAGSDGRRFHMVQQPASTPKQLRLKRSLKKTRLLKEHPLVKDAVQLVAHVRRKRGFR